MCKSKEYLANLARFEMSDENSKISSFYFDSKGFKRWTCLFLVQTFAIFFFSFSSLFVWIKISVRINTRFRTWIDILLVNNTEIQLKNAVFVTSIRQLYVNNKVLMYLFHTAEVQHLVRFFNSRILSVHISLRHIYTHIGLFWSLKIGKISTFQYFSKVRFSKV